ncbi:MAG: hypothetical protein HY584_04880 [Candidatus Omnitrophica bacterium]|nr:hypothetical protein [Candidatus Omnitrophota bacterium]
MVSDFIFSDPSKRGTIQVRGGDRVSFLHNILSNDIKSLEPSQHIQACLLNAQARIIAVFNVTRFDEYLQLACDHILKDKALEHLNKLIIMEDVTLMDRSMTEDKSPPADFEAMRIAAGVPRYGVDFDESNNPFECRLDHTVSLAKGCFPGQEILARLDSRGGVSKKLMGFELKGEAIPQKNDRITKDGNEVGFITSAAFSPTLKKTIALGYLRKEFWKSGLEIVIETGGTHIPARVEPLP